MSALCNAATNGAYGGTDTSQDDDDTSDSGWGAASFDGDGEGSWGRKHDATGADGTGTERATDSDGATSKSLNSFTQTASFTQGLDGNQPSIFSSVSFSALSQASSGQKTSYSTSASMDFPEGSSTATTDTADDQTSGWTSYAQSGTYTSTVDDGLSTSDVDVTTSQAGSFSTLTNGYGTSATDVYGGQTDSSVFQLPSELAGNSYQAQNTQTDAGNAGWLQSGSYSREQNDGHGTESSGDTHSDSSNDAWSSDQADMVAVYTPSGGEETTQSVSATGGNYWASVTGRFPDTTDVPTPTWTDPTTSSGSYVGGSGQIALDGTYVLTEGVPLLGSSDLLSPAPGQFFGAPKIQPLATAPTAGPANPSPVDFSTVEQKGATTNGALEAASTKMSADAGNAPMPASGVSQPSRAGAMTGATPQAAPSGRPEPPPLTQEMIDGLQAIGDRAGLAGPATPAAPATPPGGAGVPAAGLVGGGALAAATAEGEAAALLLGAPVEVALGAMAGALVAGFGAGLLTDRLIGPELNPFQGIVDDIYGADSTEKPVTPRVAEEGEAKAESSVLSAIPLLGDAQAAAKAAAQDAEQAPQPATSGSGAAKSAAKKAEAAGSGQKPPSVPPVATGFMDDDEFDNAADAIGDLEGVAELVSEDVTKSPELIERGFTVTRYYINSLGEQITVFYNPIRRVFTGGH